jgi:hypothetical protein
MTIEFYKWLHLGGIGLALLAVGALAHGREPAPKYLSIAHGIGLLVAFIAGFGLLARYGISWPWPGWVLAKIVLWLVFGGSIALLKRKPHLGTPFWWATWALFLVAAYLGVHKPF